MYDSDRTCPYTGDDCEWAARGLDPDYCVGCPVLMPPDDDDDTNQDVGPCDAVPHRPGSFGPSIPDDELPF